MHCFDIEKFEVFYNLSNNTDFINDIFNILPKKESGETELFFTDIKLEKYKFNNFKDKYNISLMIPNYDEFNVVGTFNQDYKENTFSYLESAIISNNYGSMEYIYYGLISKTDIKFIKKSKQDTEDGVILRRNNSIDVNGDYDNGINNVIQFLLNDETLLNQKAKKFLKTHYIEINYPEIFFSIRSGYSSSFAFFMNLFYFLINKFNRVGIFKKPVTQTIYTGGINIDGTLARIGGLEYKEYMSNYLYDECDNYGSYFIPKFISSNKLNDHSNINDIKTFLTNYGIITIEDSKKEYKGRKQNDKKH